MYQSRERVYLTGNHEAIKERWFSAANQILKPIKIALDRLYPSEVRDIKSPKYDHSKRVEHDRKKALAESFRNEQRTLLNNIFLPRYDISIAKSGALQSAAYVEMSSLLVEGCLDRLFENLGAYAPMILPKEYADEVFATLAGVFEIESKRFKESLTKYNVSYKPNVLPLAEVME